MDSPQYVLGIDTGVQHLGMALLETRINGISVIYEYNVKSYSTAHIDITDFFLEAAPNIIVYEKPFFSPKTYANNIRTLEVIGILKLIAEQLNIPIEGIAPTTIKKQFTGNGRASKQDVIDAVRLRFNFRDDCELSTHEADACAVAAGWYKLKYSDEVQ